MLSDDRSYYTPITIEGQVVEKRIESIAVARDEPSPTVTVRYTLANPYRHPISVPIQSGITLLYQYAQKSDDTKEPELHVVPATVTNLANGELLYSADEHGPTFGTATIQRRHLGTGIPNYLHPITVSVTLVPGDLRAVQAVARIPSTVERMILVDAMVGPDRRYGIYPHLIKDASNERRVPPPLRVYEGALFENDPPRLRFREASPNETPKPGVARWLDPARSERLQRFLREPGRMWCYAVGAGSTLLSLSVATRWFIVGADRAALGEVARTAVFAALAVGLVRGNRYARTGYAFSLAASAAVGLTQVAIALATGIAPATVLLTEATMIPILYAGAAAVLIRSPSVRRFTGSATTPQPPRGSTTTNDT
jgi:hypothetical protein